MPESQQLVRSSACSPLLEVWLFVFGLLVVGVLVVGADLVGEDAVGAHVVGVVVTVEVGGVVRVVVSVEIVDVGGVRRHRLRH